MKGENRNDHVANRSLTWTRPPTCNRKNISMYDDSHNLLNHRMQHADTSYICGKE